MLNTETDAVAQNTTCWNSSSSNAAWEEKSCSLLWDVRVLVPTPSELFVSSHSIEGQASPAKTLDTTHSTKMCFASRNPMLSVFKKRVPMILFGLVESSLLYHIWQNHGIANYMCVFVVGTPPQNPGSATTGYSVFGVIDLQHITHFNSRATRVILHSPSPFLNRQFTNPINFWKTSTTPKDAELDSECAAHGWKRRRWSCR